MGNYKPRKPQININSWIRAPKVRLIDQDDNQLGVVDIKEALAKAKEQELDLVEIAAKSDPPVVKITDFGKYQYALKKQTQANKRKQKVTEVKQIRFGLKTDVHDMEIKTKKAEKFIGEGHKVKLGIRLKGRELANVSIGVDKLKTVVESMSEFAKAESEIKRSGREFSIVLSKSSK